MVFDAEERRDWLTLYLKAAALSSFLATGRSKAG
jgi:hypothetical protein